ncbi:flavin monoamine oxidase family protein [Limobrevibacterium gyesilva]|uniref:Tryptophan 2-monooxygenase n=1 Tax=Limobrevibacterium gyesilva TaxID=2991712 RepID=A0AA41YKB0_9PROT|nr:NAD(P)/FAD-dependent oxidoreductase [Limobrevibacterium gyesilva]MCW3474165.1 FAD-dependent oxidoreductase [Limobrevibacterium gyesilva]
MTSDVDVIVVGAGVAGLSAAAELRARGKSCVVLEATGRIGGRALTTHPAALGHAPFDEGASWLHAAGRNPLVPIARAHGDALLDSDGVRTRRIVVGDHPATAAELADYDDAWGRFEAHARARALQAQDIGFSAALEGLRANPWTATIEMWEGTLIAAADPHDFSLHDWRVNELDGANLVVDGGIGAFVERRLGPRAGPVLLNRPVTRIAWGDKMAAETPRGAVTARACIVTVSTGVLAAGGIAFDPPLPARTQAAIAALPMGLLTKVALRATGADRLGLPDSVSLHRQVGRDEPAMFFLAWPFGRDHVVGFVGGPAAWALARAGDAATEAFARAQLRLILGSRADRTLGPAVVTRWGTDPAHRGAYAYARIGHAAARAILATPLAGGRLIFAGEAVCTDGLAGTVGGAYLSGQQAALRIVESPD